MSWSVPHGWLIGCGAALSACVLAALAVGLARARSSTPPPPALVPPSAGGPSDHIPPPAARSGDTGEAKPATKRGLILRTPAAFGGYTLFTPLSSTSTYLVDLDGQLVHLWPSHCEPGMAVHLLDDGSILRAGREPGNRHFGGGGLGGRIERIALDGTPLWQFVCADEGRCQHHDIRPLPNGNVLLVAWERKPREEVLAAGRDPRQMTGDELWPDCVLEVRPRGASGGTVVWEWHAWDHLVQDVDETKPNYGVVAEHPELIDLNYRRDLPRETPAEMRRLRALGYVGGGGVEETSEPPNGPPGLRPGHGPGGPGPHADWTHTNSIDYEPDLDQIVLSVHTFNEIWIIDHGTSTEQAAGHTGGRYGKGGDLLYRWGNPRAYGAGGPQDQVLFAQHDARWIPAGSPGAGHLMVFNNGPGRSDGTYSSIVEIAPPVDATGHYHLEVGRAFEPAEPAWEYTAANKSDFFSSHISGAHRLPNGNTLICAGEQGRLFEVTAAGVTVWEYVNPYVGRAGPAGPSGPLDHGGAGPPASGRPPRDGGPIGPGRGHHPPWPPPSGGPWAPPPGGAWGPPGAGPGGPPNGPEGGLFRATRLPADHPGVQRVLQSEHTLLHDEP